MQRIAAPMVGGMITAPLLSMFVIPAAYLLMRRPRERQVAGFFVLEEASCGGLKSQVRRPAKPQVPAPHPPKPCK